MFRRFCWIAITLFFIVGASAYTIDGDRVIFENAQARLTVWPHTSDSPVNRHKQFFSLDYLAGVAAEGIRAVYYFPEQPSGGVTKFNPPVYGWVSHKVVDLNVQQVDYNISDGLAPNTIHATAFHITDENFPGQIVIDFEGDLNSFSTCPDSPSEIKCGYRVFYEVVSGNKWVNINSKFHSAGLVDVDGESVWYYYSDDFNLSVGQSIKWMLDYQTVAKSGKWNLAFVQGDGDCLVSDTCSKQWVLDPWWKSSWLKRYAINNLVVPANLLAGDTIRLTNVDYSGMTIQCANFNDLVVVNDDTNQVLDRNTSGNISTDGNVFFNIDTDLAAATYNAKYYFYSDNAACSAPDDDVNYAILEPWEDADDWANDSSGGGGASIDAANAIKGSSIKFEADGDIDNANYGIKQAGIDANGFAFWFRKNDVGSGRWMFRLNTAGAGEVVTIINDGATLKTEFGQTPGTETFFDNFVNNVWYKLSVFKPNFGAEDANADKQFKTYGFDLYDVLNGDLNLLTSVRELSTSYGGVWGGNMTTSFTIKDNHGEGVWYWWVDEVELLRDANFTSTSFTLGTEDTENNMPDINILQIDGHSDTLPLMFSDVLNGNIAVRFYAYDADGDDMNFNMWSGATQGAKTTQHYGDINLSITHCDSDINTLLGTYCEFDLNTFDFGGDGNYFITIEVNDGTTIRAIDTNSTEFADGILIDNTPPTYTVDWNGDAWSSLHDGDQNVLIVALDATTDINSIAYNYEDRFGSVWNFETRASNDINVFDSADGNRTLQWFVYDDLGNATDVNSLYVLQDETSPTAFAHTPNSTGTTQKTDSFIFIFNVDDDLNGSPITCDWNAQKNGVLMPLFANKSVALANNVCTVSFIVSDLTVNDVIDVNARPRDSIPHSGEIFQSFEITYEVGSSPPPPPGGGGLVTFVGVIGDILTIIGVTPESVVVSLSEKAEKEVAIKVENLTSEDISIAALVSEEIGSYFVLQQGHTIIPAQESKVFKWTARLPAGVTEVEESVSGTIAFKVGESELRVPVTITQESPFFGFLFSEINGFSVLGISLVIGGLFVLSKQNI